MVARLRGVGIDTGKNKLVVQLSWQEGILSFDNDGKGVAKLVKLLLKGEPDIVTIEATNTYHRRAARACQEAGLSVLVAQPRRVRKFAEGLGFLAKTDKIDGRVIALYGLKSDAEPTKLPSLEAEALRDLVVLRIQFAEEKGRIRTLRTEATTSDIHKACDSMLQSIEREIERLDVKITKQILSDAQLAPKFKLANTVKGIGAHVAAVLVTLLPELGTLSKTQIAALVGLAPFDHQSGNRDGRKSVFGGRTRVRSALYMSALSAVRFDPFIRSVYKRLLAANKPKRVVATACMRKILVILNEMFRTGTSYNPAIPLAQRQRRDTYRLAA